MKRLVFIIALATLGSTYSISLPNPSRGPWHRSAPDSLARTFWFHNSASVDAFLANPTRGVTAISIAGSLPNKPTQEARAHSKGIAVLAGLTGSPGFYAPTFAASIKYLQKNVLDPAIAARVDGLYVDEPYGPALNERRECGPGCYVPGQPVTVKGAAWIARTYNTLFDYLKASLPNAQVGICLSSVDFHQKVLAAGLKADFVCMESYGASLPSQLATIKAAHPEIKTMLLVYGSHPLCGQVKSGLDTVDMIGFWDVDNYTHWIPGGGATGPRVGPNQMDPNWMARAKQFTSGDRSFCPAQLLKVSKNPYQ
jgi:hypothetical protein